MFEEFFDFLKPLMKCQPTEQPNNKKYHKCLQSKHTIKVIRKTWNNNDNVKYWISGQNSSWLYEYYLFSLNHDVTTTFFTKIKYFWNMPYMPLVKYALS